MCFSRLSSNLMLLSHVHIASHSHCYHGKSAAGADELKYGNDVQNLPRGAVSSLLSGGFLPPVSLYPAVCLKMLPELTKYHKKQISTTACSWTL